MLNEQKNQPNFVLTFIINYSSTFIGLGSHTKNNPIVLFVCKLKLKKEFNYQNYYEMRNKKHKKKTRRMFCNLKRLRSRSF